MLAAATAWDGLATGLSSAAANYSSTMSELTDQDWLGPSSASMAATAASHVQWLTTTASQAEQVQLASTLIGWIWTRCRGY
jgi:PPE-repeat protein